MYQDLLNYIDNVIKQDDETLRDIVGRQDFIEPDRTMDLIDEFEDIVDDALKTELGVLTNFPSDASLEEIVNFVGQDLQAADNLAQNLGLASTNFFSNTIQELTEGYIQSIDRDLAFEFFSPFTTNYIDTYYNELAEFIEVSSQTKFRNIIRTGLERGESIQEVQQRLIDNYSFSRGRARTIAITEVLASHSYAKDEAFQQSPAVTGVTWRHSGPRGINPRPHHQDLDGVTITKGSTFTLLAPTGTYQPRFPRDIILPASERVSCHCTHSAVVDSNILGLSVEEKRRLQLRAIQNFN